MGIRLSSLSLTKHSVLFACQLVVNISLVLWLYDEYLHNPFMQIYVSNVWSSIWPEVVLVVGVVVGSGAALGVYRRGGMPMSRKEASRLGSVQTQETTNNLSTLDVCPFCETQLKTISEGRLQCRSCRRYFKSSLPKISA